MHGLQRAALAFAASAAMHADATAPEAAHWEHPTGNAPTTMGRPALDVVRVEAVGRDGALRLRVRMAEDLDRFFGYADPQGRKYGGAPAEFYLDIDNNRDTGGQPWRPKGTGWTRGGYEFKVVLLLGYRFLRPGSHGYIGGDTGSIDPAAMMEVEPMVTFSLWRLKNGVESVDREWPAPPNALELARKASVKRGDWIEVSVPYAWLGVKPGDTLRLCFREGNRHAIEAVSEDKAITLGR